MDIKSISGDSLFLNLPSSRKTESKEQQESKDKIEISNEARNVAASELSTQRLEEIRQRIKTNFYSSDEIQNKIAEKILGEIKK